MKRRNRILFYSISSLAIVAVATVGFSSWIVDIEQKETTTTIDVEVDNTTVVAQVNSSTESIILNNTSVDGDGIISSDESNANADIDLSIHMIVAKEQIQNLKNITFSLDAINDTNTNINLNKIAISSNKVFGRGETTDANYLKLNITSSYDNWKDLEFGK